MGGQAGSGHGGAGAKGNGAVYMQISNHGKEADTLISAASEASDTGELHETVNEGGVMKMRPLSKIAVPADGKLEMKPGGHHVMLLGLRRDLKAGDKVTVTLTFEKAGPLSIEAPVR
jgi:copper(I)-binding protein